MKVVPFVNVRYMKGVSFLPKIVHKRVRGWTLGRSHPVLNFFQAPRNASMRKWQIFSCIGKHGWLTRNLLKLSNNSCIYKPIRTRQFGQVRVV